MRTPVNHKLLVQSRHPGAICQARDGKFFINAPLPGGHWLRVSAYCTTAGRAWYYAARRMREAG